MGLPNPLSRMALQAAMRLLSLELGLLAISANVFIAAVVNVRANSAIDWSLFVLPDKFPEYPYINLPLGSLLISASISLITSSYHVI